MNELILKNQDFKRLYEEGYSIWIKDWCLYIENIPVLNSKGEVSYTYIVSKLDDLSWTKTIKPLRNHVAYIAELPHMLDGNSVIKIKDMGIPANPSNINWEKLYQLSRKPKDWYEDYHQKMITYINIFTEQANFVDPKAAWNKWIKSSLAENELSLIHADTNASRANIAHLNKLFENQKIAIIGVWWTGSYILDLIARIPIAKIDLYDDDIYANHNFGRSPGCRTPNWKEIKSDVFKDLYSSRNKNISSYKMKIDSENLSMLDNYDFIFICIDSINWKKIITEYLNQKNINYIDSGIWMMLSNDDKLFWQIRISNKLTLRNTEVNEENIYKENIQIAEINAIAAATAVIEWKKRIWYYLKSPIKNKDIIAFDITKIW